MERRTTLKKEVKVIKLIDCAMTAKKIPTDMFLCLLLKLGVKSIHNF